ncbi:MAG: hypothetical protein CFE44_12640 [Burkholderiales bacterium PBB4]|nr:MAG: hypothetical protein CFE44_12640 [Burkholderiales bacterium PBB4]
MNGINAKAIVTLLFGLGLGIYVMVEVLLARTSSLGQLYLFMAVGAFVFGLVNPRPAMYLLMFCTVYIDVFKRLMVVGGNPTFQDVAYILAIPPLLVAGSIVSVFLGATVGRGKMTRDMFISLIVSVVVVVVTVAGTAYGSSDRAGLGKLGVIVNQGFYSFLFFTLPVLFPSDEDRRKLLHFSFLTFIPSMFYMFWQRKFGYADYETAYLMTGLTIEVKNFAESMGQVRCFSTFNGAGTASTLFSIYVLYCFVPLRPGNAVPSVFKRTGKWLLAPLFMIAAYFTIGRTGWFCGVGSLLAYAVLGTKLRARFGIFAGIGIFVTVILLAPIMIKDRWLQIMETQLKHIVLATTNDPTLTRAVMLGSVQDRVQGWANLTTNTMIWQPFGFVASGISVSNTTNADFHWGHDALIDSLINFGYVPVVLGLIIGGYLFSRVFKYMYSLPREALAFKNTRLCIALAVGILVGAMGNGAQFRNFPQNLFFSLWLAIPFATYQAAMRARKSASLAILPEDQSVEERTATSKARRVRGLHRPNPA